MVHRNHMESFRQVLRSISSSLFFIHYSGDGAAAVIRKKGVGMDKTIHYCKIVKSNGEVKALRTKKLGVLHVWIGRIFKEDPKAVILESYSR